jgi:predicted nuclease of restriction endonuclease-like RecB superfamily
MESKQLEVSCPCCSSRLLVDVRTGKVLRAVREEQLDELGKPVVREADWDQALGRVQERLTTQEERIEAALERERSKGSRLDELFRKASEKLDEEEDS